MNTSNSQAATQNLPLSIQKDFAAWVGQFKKTNNISEESSIFFNTCFDKGQVKELVSWFLSQYGEKPTINFLELLKSIGFEQATRAGISLGIEDLEIPPDKPLLITEAHIAIHKIEQQSAAGSLTSVEKSQCLIDTWNQTSDLLRQNAIQNFRNRNVVNPVYMMAFSGARGNVSQVRQLVAMRGLMADPQGAILEFPIQSNFREGLTITEYLISCYGARKGLVDTALRTATSGYLTRRLVDSAQHAVISMIDCGTNRTKILQGKNLPTRLVGRVLGQSLINTKHETFFRNHIISPTDAKLISQHYNQILVRSPLTCEATTSVCQFCYGWDLSSGKLVQLGEAVGVIAAQSIGEPGTQLTMRTFHTGGVGVFSDQSLKPIFSTYKGKIVFTDSIPGHFIRTSHGTIVYMIKYLPKNPERIFFRVQPLNSTYRDLLVREQDLPPGSILFVKHGEIVDTKTLLAQSSNVKVSKERLPESSHPVYSPLEGQIFFESMNLLVEKEVSTDFDNTKNPVDFENNFLMNENSGLPDVRRMGKIGSFWVFSAYNQHESHSINNFGEPGDLVSRNTILFTYKFHSPTRSQLQKINSELTFGQHTIQIPIEKINYFKNNYKINLGTDKFVYHKKDTRNGLLFWYPASNSNSKVLNYTFNHLGLLYTEFYSKVTIDRKLSSFCPPKGLIFRVLFLQNKFDISKHNNTVLNKLTQNYNITSVSQRSIKPNSKYFIEKALSNISSKDCLNSDNNKQILTSKLGKLGWIVVLPYKKNKPFAQISQRQFFSTGLTFNKISFPKRNVSIKSLTNINVRQVKNDICKEISIYRNWYAFSNFINKDEEFLTKLNRPLQTTLSNKNLPTTLKMGLVWYSSQKTFFHKEGLTTNFQFINSHHRYFSQANFFVIQPVSEYSFPTKNNLQKRWVSFSGKVGLENPKNLLFCKQNITLLPQNIKAKNQFKFYTQVNSGWFSSENLFRINYSTQLNLVYPHISFVYQTLDNTLSRGLSMYQYQCGMFNQIENFSYKTYQNKWILPSKSFSSGIVKIKASGEFRYKIQKTTGAFISIIRNNDILTIENTDPKVVKIGNILRWGQELQSGFASDHNGQILKKTKNQITLALGVPILASAHGIIHVFQDDLVFKNQLLITLKSRRLQTEDIVQGIPKIEQLFEARESQGGEMLYDTVHVRLRNAFLRELGTLQESDWSTAVEKSFLEAQQFLVENIVEAYANQGVKISEKHVEVIVRQMTSRVRILEAGETGLLPGELVQHNWLQKFNKHIHNIGLREATYEPIVLGISKSVLQSESFLLAASFQEVSRVLVRSALSKKRDFLRGLHENVIVGQLIPAGTGLITQLNNSQFISTKSFGF